MRDYEESSRSKEMRHETFAGLWNCPLQWQDAVDGLDVRVGRRPSFPFTVKSN